MIGSLAVSYRPGCCRYTLYVLFFSIRCKCLICSCSCANSPFRLIQAPAFADNLHLITKKSKRQYKVYRQQLGQQETGYIYTRGTALLTKIGLIGNVTVSPTEILQPVVSTITEFILIWPNTGSLRFLKQATGAFLWNVPFNL